MRFSLFRVPANAYDLGLRDLSITGLGTVVALVGPNGAGKSRLLRVVRQEAAFYRNASRNLVGELRQVEGNIEKEEAGPRKAHTLANLHRRKEQLVTLRDAPGRVFRFPPTGNDVLLDLTVSELLRIDVGGLRRNELGAVLRDDSAFGSRDGFKFPDKFADWIAPLLEVVVQAAERAENGLSQDALGDAYASLYAPARELIQKMMCMELASTPEGGAPVPTLDGRKLSVVELSEGQKRLLYYVGCLLRSLASARPAGAELDLSGAIIQLDEPERGLHPRAAREVVNGLRRLVEPSGQLWIATHSAALVADLAADEIAVVESGGVLSRSRVQAANAIESLVGGLDAIARFEAHMQEPHRWAAAKFTAECLSPPSVADHVGDDPQVGTVAALVRERIDGDGTATVTDVGAGMGRLARAIAEQLSAEVVRRITYVAVEKDEGHRSGLAKLAEDVPFRGVETRESVDDALSSFAGKCDVAVLCNVLHEVAPTEWAAFLTSVLDLLRSDGVLLVCEDLEIPVGELPHEAGFVIPNAAELQALFGLADAPVCHAPSQARHRARLLCAEIPRCAASVLPQTVVATLTMVRDRSLREVRAMRRAAARDAHSGRRLAARSQQAINATFALEDFGET